MQKRTPKGTPDRPKKKRSVGRHVEESLSGALNDSFNEERDEDNAAVDAAQEGVKTAESLGKTASAAYQKRKIKRDYAAKLHDAAQNTATAGQMAAMATSTGSGAASVSGQVLQRRKSKGWVAIVAVALMILYILNTLTACTPIVQAVLQAMVIGTYPAEEADVMAAERAYKRMENDLQDELDNYVFYHPEYDEAVIDQMELWHDPYVLIAFVSAYIGDEWTIETAYPVLERLFHTQYEVTTSVTTTHRYPPGVEQVESNLVPYKTVTVKVKNKNLSHLPCIMLSHEQLGMYALYMASLGNMPDLFAGWPHASQLEDPQLYDVPQAYKDADPQFAKLMEEAEKYVGYPYVWGGHDPSTSFDCSGFISWIFTETGVANTGRLGATGLYNASRHIADEEARPGDVIFFSGTLGEGVDGNDGITHCGLYVGDGWMIHCGNPLSFADLSRPYWQEHFYGYGRFY